MSDPKQERILIPSHLHQTCEVLGLTPYDLCGERLRWASLSRRRVAELLAARRGGRFVLITAHVADVLYQQEERDAPAALQCAHEVIAESIASGVHDVSVEAASAVAMMALRVINVKLTLEQLGDLGEMRLPVGFGPEVGGA